MKKSILIIIAILLPIVYFQGEFIQLVFWIEWKSIQKDLENCHSLG
jgi:hypothetical protein